MGKLCAGWMKAAPSPDRRRCSRCLALRLSSIFLAGSFFGVEFQHIATIKATTMIARTVAEIRTKVVVVKDLLSTTALEPAVLAAVLMVVARLFEVD